MIFSHGMIAYSEGENAFHFYFRLNDDISNINADDPESWVYNVENSDGETLAAYMLNGPETDLLDEAYDYAGKHLTATGMIPDGDIYDFYDVINQYLNKKFSSKKLKMVLYDDDEHIVKEVDIPAPQNLDINDIRGCDDPILDIDIGRNAIHRITAFLSEAKWQESKCGIDKKPILWFGLNGEPPIACWSITQERISENMIIPFWFPQFGIVDWYSLCHDWNDNVNTWVFAECGEREPENEMKHAIASCPIELAADDTPESLLKKFEAYFEDSNRAE